MERGAVERILEVLRPYAANWSGSLGRGDVVIPQREIPRLIDAIIDAIHQSAEGGQEVGEVELFHKLTSIRNLPSVQDQVTALLQSYRILKR